MISLAIIAGICKALRDRDLWGAKPKDGCELWYEEWDWYELWSQTERKVLWLPADAWHVFDVGHMVSLILAGYSCGSLLDATFCLLVVTSTFTVFFHSLLLRHPLDGIRQWLRG